MFRAVACSTGGRSAVPKQRRACVGMLMFVKIAAMIPQKMILTILLYFIVKAYEVVKKTAETKTSFIAQRKHADSIVI
jgi:hypothetical protein